MQNNNLTSVLKDALNKRNNPVDYKAIHLAKVVKLEPHIVSIYDNHILLEENVELYISEWFRFRCNIDKDGQYGIYPTYTDMWCVYIIGDAALQRVLEGDPETYSEMLERMREEK